MLNNPETVASDPAFDQLAWYAQRRPVFTGGNDVHLLKGGRALFPAMRDRIDQAHDSVWLACYLVSSLGQSGQVLAALMRAAKRGVVVHMVIDALGSDKAPATLWRDLEASGVKLATFNPLHGLWGLANPASWKRMHMKLCVVDEQIAFVGGVNLLDDLYDPQRGWSDTPRLDYALQVSGPVVAPVLHTTKAIWTRAQFGRDWRDGLTQLAQQPDRVQRIRALWQHARLRLPPREQALLAHGAALRVPMRSAFVMRDNLRQRRTIELTALQAMGQARECIDIITPYFYPRRAIRLALGRAAARGVKVRLLLQGKADLKIAAVAARVLYAELQKRGVRIHEYQAAYLHAKVLRIDHDWATVGSSNLDPLSLVLNLEANLIVHDPVFLRALSDSMDADFAQSTEVSYTADTKPGWRARIGRRLVAWLAKAYLRLAGATGKY